MFEMIVVSLKTSIDSIKRFTRFLNVSRRCSAHTETHRSAVASSFSLKKAIIMDHFEVPGSSVVKSNTALKSVVIFEAVFQERNCLWK
jgi:hypothetical protein